MERGLFNITSATTTTLREIRSSIGGNVKSIRLTNTHPSVAVTVDLFLEDEALNKAYLLSTSMPGSTSIVLSEGLAYTNSTTSLKITTSAGGLATSTPLSVIIK